MNKWTKIIVTLILLGILGGAAGYFFVYNKPHVNYEKARADFSLTGEELFRMYSAHKLQAEMTYNGKVLEVQGRVSTVENPDSMTVVVFALREGMFGDEGIRLTMLENYREKANALKRGDVVTVKGYCTGYNDTDIILEKCSIIH